MLRAMDGGSTMGLGALSEGAQVPRDVQLRPFPDTVVGQVPKVRRPRTAWPSSRRKAER